MSLLGTGHLEMLSQVCSRRCWQSTRSRSRSSTASQLESIGCSATSSRCESRWRPGRRVNSPTSRRRWPSTRRLLRASWKRRNTSRARSTICTSYVAQRFMWCSPALWPALHLVDRGHRVALATTTGDDAFGDQVRKWVTRHVEKQTHGGQFALLGVHVD